jgi:hypothetical protein
MLLKPSAVSNLLRLIGCIRRELAISCLLAGLGALLGCGAQTASQGGGSTQPPARPGYFSTESSHATFLPRSDSFCASAVTPNSSEPRPDNDQANHTILSPPHNWSMENYWTLWRDKRAKVTGNFTGTTTEIIQWAACKWGFDVNVVRAQAATESWWHQDAAGDLTADTTLWPPGATCKDNADCYQSYGLLQIKWTYWKSAWPISRDSTAFNVDAAFGWRRACYEGYIQWLSAAGIAGYPNYVPGDLWGCTGQWYSGEWYDSGAVSYIATVQSDLQNQVWLGQYF